MRPVRVTSEEALLIAARSVFQKNPGASLDEIAAAAGVGRATLFRHFKTKVDLQRAVFVWALEEVRRAVKALRLKREPGTSRAQLSLLLQTLLGVGGELRYILSATELFDDPSIVAASDEIYALVDPILIAAVEEGVVRNDMPLPWLRAAAEAVLNAAWFEVEAGTLARADALPLVEATILTGIGWPHGTGPEPPHGKPREPARTRRASKR